jgi:hypothetical protein
VSEAYKPDYISLGLVVMVILFARYRWCKGGQVDKILERIIESTDENEKREKHNAMEKVCKFIYLEVDLNQPNPIFQEDAKKALLNNQKAIEIDSIAKKLYKEIKELITEASFTPWGPKNYLQDEEFNIVLRLLSRLEKSEGKVPPVRGIAAS